MTRAPLSSLTSTSVMAVVSSSWSLSLNAKDTVEVSIGTLQAATTDSVQALALIAAEAFGATLQMSQESKSKVFQLCSKDQQSAITSFFKAKIGYVRGDSGWLLCRSDAGCRFLGLAACLLSLNHWQAAETLQELIDETSEDRRLVPTTQHLKQLLHALRQRLAHAGFLESVAEWSKLLANEHDFFKTSRGWKVPSSPTLAKIIKGMSQVARIGESNPKSHVEIELPYDETAWTVAFVRWCLGNPPKVVTSNGDRTFLEVQDFKVLIVLQSISSIKIKSNRVYVAHSISDVSELVSDLDKTFDNGFTAKGMLKSESFCQAWRRRNFDDAENLTCQQVLPFACYLTMTRLELMTDSTGDPVVSKNFENILLDYLAIKSGKDFDPTATYIMEGIDPTTEGPHVRFSQFFPDSHVISHAMRKFLQLEPDVPVMLKELPCKRFEDLPPIQALQKIPSPHCSCRNCKPSSRWTSYHDGCKRRYEFFNKLIQATAIVLLLSMFESFAEDDDFLVPWEGKVSRGFSFAIGECLGDMAGRCTVTDIITTVLTFMGHKPPKLGAYKWVMSSRRGQTIYPIIFEHLDVVKHGLFTFRCLPGSIYWKQRQYADVTQASSDFAEESDSKEESSVDILDPGYSFNPTTNENVRIPEIVPVLVPEDAYPNFEIEWLVTPREDGLTLALSAPSLPGRPDHRPLNILTAAGSGVYVNCPHDNMSPLLKPYKGLYRGSMTRPFENLREDDECAMVMTAENNPARFFTLTGLHDNCIIRADACLKCCWSMSDFFKCALIIC